jgi:hypothetical protein
LSLTRLSELEGAGGVTNPQPDPSRRSFPARATVIVGGALVALTTCVFLLLFWNRFLGLRSGDGGFSGGVFFLKGIFPYRDYYAPTPPLFIFRSAAVLALFGKLPIVTRGCGVFERVVLSLLLFGWLVRFFRVKDATLAAIVTIVVSAGDLSDPISSYNHFTIILAVASGLAASYALDEGRTKHALVIIGLWAGILCQLCVDAKQTIGLGVSCAVPVVVCLSLLRLDGVRKAIHFLTGFVTGWLAAVAILLGWMAHFGVLHPFFTQAFIQGPAAKAPNPGDFVLHTLVALKFFWWAASIALCVIVICWRPLRKSESEKQWEAGDDSMRAVVLTGLFGLGMIVVSSRLLYPWNSLLVRLATPSPAKPAIYLSLLGSGWLLIYYSWRFLQRSLLRRQSQFALFASIAFTVAFMTSLSFPAFEAMCIPGLALFVVVLLNEFEDRRRFYVFAVCGLLLVCETQFKAVYPFAFAGWRDPSVKYATMASSLPELRGFLLPPDTVDFVDSTVRIIGANSVSSDTIFIYPELGFFYGATERKPATFSASHNMDVVPDWFMKQEAERLLRVRPAVLIYAPLPEGVLRWDENFWRNGKPSGQRDLIAAVEILASQYKLVRTFKLRSWPNLVNVYVRP